MLLNSVDIRRVNNHIKLKQWLQVHMLDLVFHRQDGKRLKLFLCEKNESEDNERPL